MRFLFRAVTALLAVILGAIAVPVFIILDKIAGVFLDLITLGKWLFVAARNAYRTGNIITEIGNALIAIGVTAQSITLRFIWNFGVVIPLYPIFLGLYVGIGLCVGAIDGLPGVLMFCTSSFTDLIKKFNNAINIDEPNAINIDEPNALNPINLVNNIINRRPLYQRLMSINDLYLSETEIATLREKHTSHEISTEDNNTLKESSNPSIKTLMYDYNTLYIRLNQDLCPILFERPEKNNALLMIKYYQYNEQWLLVPKSSYIFDKDCLIKYFATGSKHPILGDQLDAPDRHDGHPTRYKLYPYYSSENATDGNSEELSEIYLKLQEHLHWIRTPSAPSKKTLRESRIAFFSKPNTVITAAEETHDDQHTDTPATVSSCSIS